MNDQLGATAADWYAFDFELGLSKHLLPCVPASPDVRVAEDSSLKGKVGKIPSQFNGAGEAHGLKAWNTREILPAEVQAWSRDRRLNICVRTGAISGVYAIDVDVEAGALVSAIERRIWLEWTDLLPKRARSNSGKFLIPFRIAGGEKCPKRIITVVPADKEAKIKPQRIELLADGQQFVAAGTHSSGVRYEWRPELPTHIPTLTIEQLNTVWTALSTAFEAAPSPTKLPDTSTTSAPESVETLTVIGEDDWQALLQALRFLLPHAADNDTWSEIGYALLSLQKSRPAEQLFTDFSRKAVGYVEGAPEQWWSAHRNQPPRSDYRHIFKLARGFGWRLQSSPDAFPPVERPADELDITPPPPPTRSILRLSDALLNENVAQLSQLAYPIVYSQGNMLTRMGRENLDDEIRRNIVQLKLISVSTGWTRTHFTEIAQFMRYDGRAKDWVPCSCPGELATVWLDQGDWPQLRPLDAIARAPFVRVNGSVCDVAGYDPTSRVLYIPIVEYPPVPHQPMAAEASAALERLLAPFDQFPWYTHASRSAFAAHILTEAARLAVDRAPMFWYTAPDAGTGKSLLSEMPALIVHGAEPALRPWGVDGEELRKTLFASLLAGDRSIAFDNVPTGYKARAPELCAFLTSAVWKDRKLGVSETHEVPNRSVVSASGNNVTPVSDLARRSIVIRLDANSQGLKERKFRIPDLRSFVLANRPGLLVDALTVIRAYAISEPPAGIPTPLPSFEQWSRLVRDPLVWLGLPDPCMTQETETDDETFSVEGILEKLSAMFGDREFTHVDVARAVGSLVDTNGELSAIMMATGCSEPNSSQKVGYWLRSLRDKTAGGLKLVNVGVSKMGAKWQLKRIGVSNDLV